MISILFNLLKWLYFCSHYTAAPVATSSGGGHAYSSATTEFVARHLPPEESASNASSSASVQMTDYHQRTFPLRKSSSRNSGEFGTGSTSFPTWRQSNEELETAQKRKSTRMEEPNDKGKRDWLPCTRWTKASKYVLPRDIASRFRYWILLVFQLNVSSSRIFFRESGECSLRNVNCLQWLLFDNFYHVKKVNRIGLTARKRLGKKVLLLLHK